MEEDIKIVEVPLYECYKCDEVFSDERTLKRHIRANRCIGVWYVCKRCLNFFDTPSDLKRHQSLKRGCAKAVLSGKVVSTASKMGAVANVPIEALAAVRLQKGADDAGGMTSYLENVAKRGDHHEVTSVLLVCSLDELDQLLSHISSLSDDTALFIDLLAVLSDYSNTDDVSPEKRAKLRAFVDLNVRL